MLCLSSPSTLSIRPTLSTPMFRRVRPTSAHRAIRRSPRGTVRSAEPMKYWWDRYPARLARELDELTAAGIEHRRVGPRDCYQLELSWNFQGQMLKLEASYPSYYPYFAPMVVAPGLALTRHQTPGTHQLCLLDRGGEGWRPESDTLASLLQNQLPRVFANQTEVGHGDTGEAREGVPITGFLQYETSSFVGVPAFELPALPASGILKFVIESYRPLRGTVIAICDEEGRELVRYDARDEAFYVERKAAIWQGRWVKLDKRVGALDAKGYLAMAVAADSTMQAPRWQALPGAAKARLDLTAIFFPDEMTWHAHSGNAIVLSRRQETAGQDRTKIVPELHRSELESRTNHFMRDPTYAQLQTATVCLVGNGSVGSPAAKLLAQAGLGALRTLDHDILDSANAIRWELGRAWAGRPKSFALGQHIEANFPYCRVTAMVERVGDPTLAGSAFERTLDDHLFHRVDCLFDATASIRVGHFLSETARDRGIPYVWMHATNGGWGGLVGVQSPDRSQFCWTCHLLYLAKQPLIAAPEDTFVQPAGCMDPTFIGAQVDLAEVSLAGTRRVLAELLAKANKDVPDHSWNFATLRLRDDAGRPQVPSWESQLLPPHADCPKH